MSKSGSSFVSVGIGFSDLLGILFIALKLTHVINWSWWLILLPIYGPLVIALAIVAVFLVIWIGAASATGIIAYRQKKRVQEQIDRIRGVRSGPGNY